jgi:hypothetical protein
MPRTTLQHSETWYLIIDREEGDDWPDMPPYTSASYLIRPDRLAAHITRDIAKPHVTISGLRLKKDGTTGSLRSNHTVYSSDRLTWVDEAVSKARSKHNITEEALSR